MRLDAEPQNGRVREKMVDEIITAIDGIVEQSPLAQGKLVKRGF